MRTHSTASASNRHIEALGVGQVAALLGLSRDTVERRIAAGVLPARRDGRRVLVLADDLAAYLAALPPYAAPTTAPTGSTTTPPTAAPTTAEVARP